MTKKAPQDHSWGARSADGDDGTSFGDRSAAAPATSPLAPVIHYEQRVEAAPALAFTTREADAAGIIRGAGVHVRELRAWARRGLAVTKGTDGHLVVLRAELEAWLRAEGRTLEREAPRKRAPRPRAANDVCTDDSRRRSFEAAGLVRGAR